MVDFKKMLAKGEFVQPPDEAILDQQIESLPVQEDFWRPPVRFGAVPVEKEPLGWDRHRKFFKLYPRVLLPTQVVERVSFGHPELEPNRLFWGDNLHVMRQLPPESIDLIYIDPPFFSGRQYNVIFGDQNELRSFSDIWEGGMPGYLIWLNARLFEMKRLLKKTGSIYVHLDWHAAQYVKMEMDKIFGHDNFLFQIIWWYENKPQDSRKRIFPRNYDMILSFAKHYGQHNHHTQWVPVKMVQKQAKVVKVNGKRKALRDENGEIVYELRTEKVLGSVWDIPYIHPIAKERIGYPTQKPED